MIRYLVTIKLNDEHVIIDRPGTIKAIRALTRRQMTWAADTYRHLGDDLNNSIQVLVTAEQLGEFVAYTSMHGQASLVYGDIMPMQQPTYVDCTRD